MNDMKRRYMLLTIGGVIGMIAAFLQTLEKIVLIENKDAVLPCNIDDVFSCSVVLSAPQSSLFGFPNSLICLIVFTLFATIGLVGWAGSSLTKRVHYATQGLALFMLLFALWFLLTSTYIIGAVCIFCLVCMAGLLLINGALWRLNFSALPGTGRIENIFTKITKYNFDILVWICMAGLLSLLIILKFYI